MQGDAARGADPERNLVCSGRPQGQVRFTYRLEIHHGLFEYLVGDNGGRGTRERLYVSARSKASQSELGNQFSHVMYEYASEALSQFIVA